MLLHSTLELKEQLTEHLYTVINENETRKARKLAELMGRLNVEGGAEEGEGGGVGADDHVPHLMPFDTAIKSTVHLTAPGGQPGSAGAQGEGKAVERKEEGEGEKGGAGGEGNAVTSVKDGEKGEAVMEGRVGERGEVVKEGGGGEKGDVCGSGAGGKGDTAAQRVALTQPRAAEGDEAARGGVGQKGDVTTPGVASAQHCTQGSSPSSEAGETDKSKGQRDAACETSQATSAPVAQS